MKRKTRVRLIPDMFIIEVEREDDGRWLASFPHMPGVMCYGKTRELAVTNVRGLALRVFKDRLAETQVSAQ